jgi:hypothetical protein
MKYVRRLIYRLGFRPKPGTVLFSPSTAMVLAANQATPAFIEGLKQAQEFMGACFRETCDYVGKHKHGPVCDFVCICQKGQNFNGIRE